MRRTGQGFYSFWPLSLFSHVPHECPSTFFAEDVKSQTLPVAVTPAAGDTVAPTFVDGRVAVGGAACAPDGPHVAAPRRHTITMQVTDVSDADLGKSSEQPGAGGDLSTTAGKAVAAEAAAEAAAKAAAATSALRSSGSRGQAYVVDFHTDGDVAEGGAVGKRGDNGASDAGTPRQRMSSATLLESTV
jgi:hypothetical protein